MIHEGELLWTPSADWIANANITKFTQWLGERRGLSFPDYELLRRWSVKETEAFWGALWDYFDIKSSAPYERVLASAKMPGAKWFPGARLNYAEHVLRRERAGADAVLFVAEGAAPVGVRWEDFAGAVRILATQLRALGVKPGDRVASYAPNIPQTMIAMLATTAIGAIWASCSPDFGSRGVLDRFAQLRPKALFCVDGYRYGGKTFDRRDELSGVVAGLNGLELVVEISHLGSPGRLVTGIETRTFESLIDHPPVSANGFAFEQVPFDHPLWILFSSGTTGLPKPIVHGHGGILIEVFKTLSFHMDIHPGERAFFYSTTGWMMWNVVASMPMTGACPVLYDGHPAYPDVDALWRMADVCEVSFFGASPSYVDIMRKASVVPKERYALSKLRAIMPAGSPVSAECTAWFYSNVKSDLWVATGSGGTDVCSGLVGGVPTLPVYAGEIQARQLGAAVEAFDENGASVVDGVGELVIVKPLPSMPIFFWGDEFGRTVSRGLFRRLPRRLAARRSLAHQRARRLFRARPLRRDAQSPRNPHRHGGDLSHARCDRRDRRQPHRQPGPAGRPFLHAVVRQAQARRRTRRRVAETDRRCVARRLYAPTYPRSHHCGRRDPLHAHGKEDGGARASDPDGRLAQRGAQPQRDGRSEDARLVRRLRRDPAGLFALTGGAPTIFDVDALSRRPGPRPIQRKRRAPGGAPPRRKRRPVG